MLLSIFYIVIGFVLLVVGGEYLVRSSVALSFKFNISKMVIGLTVVSFATSLPELLVSLQAALDGFSDISLGNVIGSNIANIGLVLGITSIISAIDVDKDFYKFNWPVMLLFSLALYVFLQSDLEISRVEGGIFVGAILIYLIILIKRARKQTNVTVEEVDDSLQVVSGFKIIIWLLIGGAALYFGSDWLVEGAVDIATEFGVSERIISVTMIAIGTSVPELAASVMAALKKEKALSLGNLIGSNIFNIGSVLGLTALIKPIAVESQEVLTKDILWMLGFAIILLPLVFLPKKYTFSRYKGLIIFVGYAVFVGLTFLS
ncbi:cation:H+ antiporter [Mesonia phycicola]|uniref:Cation:H+ antiporter n=1 Tax=Mesonia phycicola TaxID=579105 RepID=A0A1M6GPE5_9FLAO|nr:calcium/sodium antiporter [Mesonia phycicola]SHJ11740.1 cation:H+ antiporter [Mesonia phycicola]